jgi:hypothetical protein
MVAAVDQHVAHAGGAQFGEGDFGRAGPSPPDEITRLKCDRRDCGAVGFFVIASEAKQAMEPQAQVWIVPSLPSSQ